MKHKIGAYIRVSTEEQAQVIEGSLDSQRHRLNSFVEVKNVQEPDWGKIVEVYCDEGLSAKDTRRPAFQRMMKDIRQGKINFILVTDLARLSRNILDFCLLLDELGKHHAKCLSMKEQFDTSTPAGEMMVFNMINLAQFERKQTAERVSMNFHSRALRGLRNGGSAVLGFDVPEDNSSIFKVNETEAARVREIFDIYLEERSCPKTIARLNSDGILPKAHPKRSFRLVNNGKWNRQTLVNILRNPTYIGKREVNRKNKDAKTEDLKPWQKHQLVKAAWPAIVDESVFSEVQKALDADCLAQSLRFAKKVTRVFLASGIFKCYQCGGNIKGAASHGKYRPHRYYVHSHLKGEKVTCKIRRFRADEVEAAIVNHMIHVLKREGYLDGIESRIETNFKARFSDKEHRLADFQRQYCQLEKEIESAFKLHSELGSGAGVELVREQLAKLSDRKTELKVQIEALKDELSEIPGVKEARAVVERHVEKFQKMWSKATPAQQKFLTRLVFESLVMTPDGIDVYYWTTEEQAARAPASKDKKAPGDQPAAVYYLNDFRKLNGAVPSTAAAGYLAVAGASADKNGGGAGS